MSPKGDQQATYVKWEGEELECVANVLYLRVSHICKVIYKCGRTFTNTVLVAHLQPLQYKEAYCFTLEVQNFKFGESTSHSRL